VERGQLIGKMGNNNGMYSAHLHLEVRKNLGIGMNRSKFARDYSNYYSPTVFIQSHRQLAADFKKYEMPVNTFAPYGQDLNKEQIAFANSRGMSATVSSGSSSGKGAKDSSTAAVRKTAGGLSIPLTASARGSGSNSTISSSASSKEATPVKDTASSTSKGKSKKKKPDEPETPKVAEKKNPEPATVPVMVPPTEPKSDFWTRLKSKLSNGEVFDPSTSNPPK
jgi:hypothetical protein